MALASIRPAAVAGQFYPRDERVLRTQLAEMLSTAVAFEAAPEPKAIIVPHAGYMYSGPVAASAYALLAPLRERIRRVVMLGPTHRVAVRGFSLPAAQCFSTPLGEVPLARGELGGPAGARRRPGRTTARTPSSTASRCSSPSSRSASNASRSSRCLSATPRPKPPPGSSKACGAAPRP